MISLKNKIKWSWKTGLILIFSILISLTLFFLYEVSEERQSVFASPGTLIIRPDAVGAVTGIDDTGPTTTLAHWEMVDEVTADDDETYVINESKNTTQWDLYSLVNHTSETETIDSVTVWIKARQFNKSGSSVKTVIKTKNTEYRGEARNLLPDPYPWLTTSTVYINNPSTTVAWIWSEIDNLEAGAEFVAGGSNGVSMILTQVWVVVEYSVANDDPVVEEVSLTPDPITLTENTTTTVTCTSTISDQQQGSTIVSATATIYRSGVASAYDCTANDNNCYQNITPLATSSAGIYFYATFTKDIWFHAEPTDEGVYATAQGWNGQNWQCYVIAEDDQGATGTSSDGVELNTLSALITASTINYGSLGPGATSSASVIITATTTGNIPIDVKLKGQDLVSNGGSIEGDQQEYATSSVDYGTGAGIALATTTYADLKLESLKPTLHDPIQATATDIIYWRIGIPADQEFGTYYGTTSVAAKSEP